MFNFEFREEVGKYSIEMRKMGFKVLELIAEGLGLNKGHFEEVGQEQAMAINHYPPCPDPSLAMGIASHTDPNLITFLQQDHYGLQIQKDEQWMGIEPIPNAFVVNLGCQLQVYIHLVLQLMYQTSKQNRVRIKDSFPTKNWVQLAQETYYA